MQSKCGQILVKMQSKNWKCQYAGRGVPARRGRLRARARPRGDGDSRRGRCRIRRVRGARSGLRVLGHVGTAAFIHGSCVLDLHSSNFQVAHCTRVCRVVAELLVDADKTVALLAAETMAQLDMYLIWDGDVRAAGAATSIGTDRMEKECLAQRCRIYASTEGRDVYQARKYDPQGSFSDHRSDALGSTFPDSGSEGGNARRDPNPQVRANAAVALGKQGWTSF